MPPAALSLPPSLERHELQADSAPRAIAPTIQGETRGDAGRPRRPGGEKIVAMLLSGSNATKTVMKVMQGSLANVRP